VSQYVKGAREKTLKNDLVKLSKNDQVLRDCGNADCGVARVGWYENAKCLGSSKIVKYGDLWGCKLVGLRVEGGDEGRGHTSIFM